MLSPYRSAPYAQRQANFVPASRPFAIGRDRHRHVLLFEEVRNSPRAPPTSLDDLRTARERLFRHKARITLGQPSCRLRARDSRTPAHYFVTNFTLSFFLSPRSSQDVGPISWAHACKPVNLCDKKRAETRRATHMLKGNLERGSHPASGAADSNRKNMLLLRAKVPPASEAGRFQLASSRRASIFSAYHGARGRAEKHGFPDHAGANFDFDPAAGDPHFFPQELAGAFSHLISQTDCTLRPEAHTSGNIRNGST